MSNSTTTDMDPDHEERCSRLRRVGDQTAAAMGINCADIACDGHGETFYLDPFTPMQRTVYVPHSDAVGVGDRELFDHLSAKFDIQGRP